MFSHRGDILPTGSLGGLDLSMSIEYFAFDEESSFVDAQCPIAACESNPQRSKAGNLQKHIEAQLEFEELRR